MTQEELEEKYEEIERWLVLAIESEQPNGPEPFKLETELRMVAVLKLAREGLGLPPLED